MQEAARRQPRPVAAHKDRRGQQAASTRAMEGPTQTAADPWHLYEARKRAWSAEHPGASAAEYEQAMRRIALDAGL